MYVQVWQVCQKAEREETEERDYQKIIQEYIWELKDKSHHMERAQVPTTAEELKRHQTSATTMEAR